MTYLRRPTTGDTEPGIHILLIGVTDYFHLPGGRGAPFEPGNSFPPLDAPDYSCRELGNWFLEGNLRHPTLPIKSIEVLASKLRFTDENGVTQKVGAPSYAEVSAAIDRWYALGNLSPENLLIFYFCGHGLQNGSSTHSLLCADFGERANAPFQHAIHYEGLESGMRACAARQQIFILDMCRNTEPDITNSYRGSGSPVVERLPPEDMPAVSQSVIWATSANEEAWAQNKKPSLFAQAFMKSFYGAAATVDAGSSAAVANAASIRAATLAWISATGGALQEPQYTQPTGRQFAIHQFDDVRVPVIVKCMPEQLTAEADFSCWQSSRRLRKSASTARRTQYWHVDLPQGAYTFRASFPSGDESEVADFVYPPLKPVFIASES